MKRVYVQEIINLPSDELAAAAWLKSNGAISIKSFPVHGPLMYGYSGGVYSPTAKQCADYTSLHSMAIIGFDLDGKDTGGIPYWVVKNSWSVGWGESGYMRIRFGENVCGLAQQLVSAL